MDLSSTATILRRRTGLELVDLSLRAVRALAPKEVLRLMAWFLLPAALILGLAWWKDVSWWLLWPGAFVLVRLLELPFVQFFGARQFDPSASARQAVQTSRASAVSYLGAMLLYGLLWTFGSLVLVGALLVGAQYFFLPEVVALERQRPLDAFRRARQFVGRRTGSAYGLLTLLTLMRICFVLGTEILGQAAMTHLLDVHEPLDALWEAGGSPFALLGLLLSVPYAGAFQYFAYINERTIADGWDVQVAFLGIATSQERRGGPRAA